MPIIASGLDLGDYSGGPTGAQIAASSYAGFSRSFACGYLDVLTSAQVSNFNANAVSVVYIWENTVNFGGTTGGTPRQSSYFSYSNGLKDGVSAFGSFGAGKAAVPAARPVYFTVDFDAGPSALGGIGQYFQGILASTGDITVIGIYGGAYVLDYIKNQGSAYYFWQNESTGYINNSTHYPYAAMQQVYPPSTVGGVSVDNDVAFIQDFGQYPAPSISGPPAGGTSVAQAPSGGTYDASVNAVSSFAQPSDQSLITPATGHDQVIYSVTTSDATLATGSHNAFYEIPTTINQPAYPIGIFSYDGGATWNDFGFQLQSAPAYSSVTPAVTLQPSVDGSGNIFFNGVNNTGKTVNLIVSVALLASYNPGVLTSPPFYDTNVSYTNQHTAIPPYVQAYSSYRRIAKDSNTGTGSVTVAHTQSTIPNIMFWVNVGGFTTINAIGWQSTGSLGALGIKMDSTNLNFHVDGGTYNDCYYRVYKDN